MKVRIKKGIASAEWSYAPGQVADLPDDLAKAWIKSGIAEAVKEKIETATIEPSETAVTRSKPRKAGK